MRVPVADGGDGTVDAALAAGLRAGPGARDRPDRGAGRHRLRGARRGRGGRDGRRLRPAAAAAGPARAAHRDLLRHGRGRPRRAGPGLPQRRARHRRQREHGRRRGHAGGARRRGCSTPPGTRCPAAAGRWPTSTASTCPACTRPWPAPGSSSPATSTTRCSARTAPPRSTGRRRARPGRRRARSTPRWRTGRTCVDAATGRADVRDRAGAGAAGGVGYAAMAVLGAELEPGIGLVLDLVRLRRPPARGVAGDHRRGVARRADPARQGPGRRGRGGGEGRDPGRDGLGPARAGPATQLQTAGIAAAYALTDIEPDVQRCLADAGPLLETPGHERWPVERIGGTTP